MDAAYDILEELQFRLGGSALHEALAAQAAQLSPGEGGRALFLAVLGDFLEMDEQPEPARAAYQEAIADGGPCALHPLSGLLSVELRSGDPDIADTLLARLRALARAGELNESTCENIGELLEQHDRLQEALRWFNIPLRDIDPDDVEDLPIGCLNGRFRVRRLLELPMDRYDDATEAARAAFIAARAGR